MRNSDDTWTKTPWIYTFKYVLNILHVDTIFQFCLVLWRMNQFDDPWSFQVHDWRPIAVSTHHSSNGCPGTAKSPNTRSMIMFVFCSLFWSHHCKSCSFQNATLWLESTSNGFKWSMINHRCTKWRALFNIGVMIVMSHGPHTRRWS